MSKAFTEREFLSWWRREFVSRSRMNFFWVNRPNWQWIRRTVRSLKGSFPSAFHFVFIQLIHKPETLVAMLTCLQPRHRSAVVQIVRLDEDRVLQFGEAACRLLWICLRDLWNRGRTLWICMRDLWICRGDLWICVRDQWTMRDCAQGVAVRSLTSDCLAHRVEWQSVWVSHVLQQIHRRFELECAAIDFADQHLRRLYVFFSFRLEIWKTFLAISF